MKPQRQPSGRAGQAGALIGRAWQRWRRQEQRLTGSLLAWGFPAKLAKSVPCVIRITALGIVLYAATWFALLLVISPLAAWVVGNVGTNTEEDQTEWRNGWDGYGLYRGGLRIDGGGADDDE